MKKIFIGLIIGLPVAIVIFVLWMLIKLNHDISNAFGAIQKTQEEVHRLGDISTSTSPFVQLFNGVVQANQALVNQVKAPPAATPGIAPIK